MPFLLSRAGRNVPAEVQRWQYYLLKHGFGQVGAIDGDFGAKTEVATKFFQVKNGLNPSGSLDKRTLDFAGSSEYSILPDDYYRDRAGDEWPAKPPGTKSPSNSWRNKNFTCFKFTQVKRQFRPERESIVIGASCDGKSSDWIRDHIVDIAVPQLRFASGYPGYVRCHTKAATALGDLFKKWEADDLLHLILRYEGCFNPRYKRNHSPGDAAQPERESVDVNELSNHSFGSAIDMNYSQNEFPATAALCGEKGSTRELVDSAAALGFYWGGFFQDGNHFELAK